MITQASQSAALAAVPTTPSKPSLFQARPSRTPRTASASRPSTEPLDPSPALAIKISLSAASPSMGLLLNRITRYVRFLHITQKKPPKRGYHAKRNPQNGSPTGTPTTGVPITDLTVSGVTGTVASSGTNVYILCGKGSCSGWTWTGNKVTGGKTSTSCENVPSGASC